MKKLPGVMSHGIQISPFSQVVLLSCVISMTNRLLITNVLVTSRKVQCAIHFCTTHCTFLLTTCTNRLPEKISISYKVFGLSTINIIIKIFHTFLTPH
jgi:hypothetical protein